MQFRSGLVRIVLWLVLRFGRAAEALEYGTPDVHFYTMLALARRQTRTAGTRC